MAAICLTIGWISLYCFQAAAPAADNALAFQASFDKSVKPFLKAHCERCHHVEKSTSGVRVDHLNAALDDRHVKLWDSIRKQISDKIMPPAEEPQPTNEERDRIVGWITQGLDAARLRPTPKNGSVRRLTVSQYRNTLRELLKLEDDLADILPPDAISRDGFVNNQETLGFPPSFWSLISKLPARRSIPALSIPHPSRRSKTFALTLAPESTPNHAQTG